MEKWSNVHLMFCEGPHDAAILNRLLKTQLNFKKVELKLSELPYPISNVIQQSFKTRAADDLRLDLAKKFFLPDYIVASEGVLVLVFNYGGSNRKANMAPFLENVFALLNAPAFSGNAPSASSAKLTYAIFADADAIGLVAARAEVSADLANIGGVPWLTAAWSNFAGTMAVTQESQFGTTAAYVWKKSSEDNGTLEDCVQECLVGHPGLQQTLQFIDTRFDWTAPANAAPKQISAIAAKRLKAAFCIEGQKEKPGGSLGVVLDQTDLLRPESIAASAAIQDCLTFLRAWLTPLAQQAVA
jgi:hypothetical protein